MRYGEETRGAEREGRAVSLLTVNGLRAAPQRSACLRRRPLLSNLTARLYLPRSRVVRAA